MKLLAPTQTPLRQLQDIHGMPIQIGQGRKMLLSMFREATCPFRMVANPQGDAHQLFAARGMASRPASNQMVTA